MLKTLIVYNYSLIENLHIDFQQGFSVITGETGAGKSIMLGALGLLLGQRADIKAIRTGASKCVIEGHFSLSSNKYQAFFTENDLEYDPSECIIRREVYTSGKSRAFINDTPVPLTLLKELGERLIDIHSQHKNLFLNKEDFQMGVLDILAHHDSLLSAYQTLYRQYKEKIAQLQDSRELIRKHKEEEEFLNFQFTQLDEAHLCEGEQEELESELEILSHAEEIKQSLYTASNLMEESEGCIISQLKSLQSTLRVVDNVYSPAQEWQERLESALIELKDIAEDISFKSDEIEFNPQRMEYVNDRLNTIYTLQKKHRVQTVSELIKLKEELQHKLHFIANSDESIELLKAQLAKIKSELSEKAQELSEGRKKSAKVAVTKLISLLNQLGMSNVQFKIDLQQTEEFKANGIDEVRFLFNANKGGPLQELSQVASGGEIARVMLSIKSLMAGIVDLPTLIFDEIDTGVSGSIADKMALIMKNMSEQDNRQVISITHLPQIAAKGRVHFKVYKEDINDTTVSHIIALSEEQRVEELAHMLSGETITQAALNNAKELLNS